MDGVPTTLAGRYELGEVIGRGGMGTVYRATDLVLQRAVAVKVLPVVPAEEDPVRVARFEREARSAASLSHRGVVAVFDAGVDDKTRFIVMELVAGVDLAAVVREQAPLEPARAARIGEQLSDALAGAHAAGVVHRDIKPANVMLDRNGSIKVLDFGIARASDDPTLTGSALVVGSASYMAPEQARGDPADARSDIYALGCLLYALLTGRPPFAGRSPAAVVQQHDSVLPRHPMELNPEVPPALDALVMAMLSKAPSARPGGAAEVRDALSALSSHPPAGAATAGAAQAATQPTARLRETTVTRTLAGARTLAVTRTVSGARTLSGRARSGRRGAAISVGIAALLIVIVLLALGSPAHGPSAPARRGKAISTAAPAARALPASSAAVTPPAVTNGQEPARQTFAGLPEHRHRPHGHRGTPPGRAKKKLGTHPPEFSR